MLAAATVLALLTTLWLATLAPGRPASAVNKSSFILASSASGTCSDAARVVRADNQFASCGNQAYVTAGFQLSGAGLPAGAVNIGFTVQVGARVASSAGVDYFDIALSSDNGETFTIALPTQEVDNQGSAQEYYTAACSSFDRTWAPADLADTAFRVRATAVTQQDDELYLDWIALQVCWEEPAYGQLTIEKLLADGDAAPGQQFGVTVDGTEYSVSAGQPLGPLQLLAGSHTARETAPGDGWTLVGYRVVGANETCGTDGYQRSANNDITFELPANQSRKLCVLNEPVPPPPTGSIAVTLSVNWNGAPPDESASFQFCITPPPADAPACRPVGHDGGTVTWEDIPIGSYQVHQTAPAPFWGSTVNGAPGLAASVEVATDTTASAAFTNTLVKGALHVSNDVDWNGFDPDPAVLAGFQYCSAGAELSHCFTDPDNSGETLYVLPGTYVVTLTPPDADWFVQAGDTPGTTAVVNVRLGRTVEAAFRSTRGPATTVIAKKVVTNVQADTNAFAVTLQRADVPSGAAIGTIAESPALDATFSHLPPGTYLLGEQPAAGYRTLGWSFAETDGECPAEPATGGNTANVTASGGETTVVCFYSAAIGNLVIQAVEDRDGDGFHDPEDLLVEWSVTVTGPDFPDGATHSLTDGSLVLEEIAAGEYLVAPDSRSGYRHVGARLDDGMLIAGSTLTATVPHLGTTAVTLYLQPVFTIRVEVADSVGNDPAPAEGIAVTLAGCGITTLTEVSDEHGIVLFEDLPLPAQCAYSLSAAERDGWLLPDGLNREVGSAASGDIVTVLFTYVAQDEPTPSPTGEPADPDPTETATPSETAPAPTGTTTPEPPTRTETATPTATASPSVTATPSSPTATAPAPSTTAPPSETPTPAATEEPLDIDPTEPVPTETPHATDPSETPVETPWATPTSASPSPTATPTDTPAGPPASATTEPGSGDSPSPTSTPRPPATGSGRFNGSSLWPLLLAVGLAFVAMGCGLLALRFGTTHEAPGARSRDR